MQPDTSGKYSIVTDPKRRLENLARLFRIKAFSDLRCADVSDATGFRSEKRTFMSSTVNCCVRCGFHTLSVFEEIHSFQPRIKINPYTPTVFCVFCYFLNSLDQSETRGKAEELADYWKRLDDNNNNSKSDSFMRTDNQVELQPKTTLGKMPSEASRHQCGGRTDVPFL